MSLTVEQLAQAIFEKAARVEVGLRHENTIKEPFLNRAARKFLARILRPVTSLIKESVEFQKVSFTQTQEAIDQLNDALVKYEKRLNHFQNVIAENNRHVLSVDAEIVKLKSQVSADGNSSNFQGETWDDFYKRFEDRFRGDPKSIQERLVFRYKERLVEKFQHFSSPKEVPTLVDLGCGRGEFLNVARDVGFKTVGVDLGTAMVRETASKGHEAHLDDLYARLKTYPDCSIDVLTMFHVIEHCHAEYILKLYKEAARVLKPGGAFVVETPSIFSLWVTSRQFYLDPTHTQPVHPDYISFMALDSGFSKTELLSFEIVEHPERASLAALTANGLTSEFRKLENWLYGPQDICVWSTK